ILRGQSKEMAASRYRKFLKLCDLWPTDVSKTDRDLGLYIRQRIADGFRQGEASQINEKECDRVYDALHRICVDTYKKRYPRLGDNTGASGLKLDDCRLVSSTEGMKSIQNSSPSVFSRIKSPFSRND